MKYTIADFENSGLFTEEELDAIHWLKMRRRHANEAPRLTPIDRANIEHAIAKSREARGVVDPANLLQEIKALRLEIEKENAKR